VPGHCILEGEAPRTFLEQDDGVGPDLSTAGAGKAAPDGRAGGAADVDDEGDGGAVATDAEAPLVTASESDGTCSVAWLPGDGERAGQLKLEVDAFLASYTESPWAPSCEVLPTVLTALRNQRTLRERSKGLGLCQLALAKAPAVLLLCGSAARRRR